MAKPLLFGDGTFDADRIEAMRAVRSDWDDSYVPGYSEARRDNEHRVRDGQKPVTIPRLQWLRVGHLDATNVGNKDMREWMFLGYQFVKPADLKEWGFGMPPAAHVDAAGLIRREDVALAYVSSEQHVKNLKAQNEINRAFHSAEALEDDVRSKRAPLELKQFTNTRLNSLNDVGASYLDD